MSQLVFISICFFMVCISIILWINWRKIGYPLIILIIISLAVISFGSGKLLNESIKFNLPAFNSSLSISSLDDDSQFLSRGLIQFEVGVNKLEVRNLFILLIMALKL